MLSLSRRSPATAGDGRSFARPRAASALGLLLAAVFVVAVVAWPSLRDDPGPAPVGSATGAAAYRGGAARTGTMPGPGPIDAPRLLWRHQTAGFRFNAPVVDGEVVYLASTDNSVVALSVWTGEVLWRVESDNDLATPAVADGLVFVGGYDLAALDAATGQERWSFATPGGVWGSPAVVDGVVYAVSNGSIEESPVTGHVFAIEAVDGDLIWEAVVPGDLNASPAVAGGMVYVHSGVGLYALDAATGQERWQAAVGYYWRYGGSPVVVDGTVYHFGREGAAGGDDGETKPMLRAFDATTGQERWSVGFGESFGILNGPSPAVAGGVVYVGGREFLYALDAATGRELWRANAGHETNDPVVVGNVVYVTAQIYEEVYGAVLAFDAATGRELWRFGTPDVLPTNPVVVDGVVFAAGYNFDADDGMVYAIWGPTEPDPVASPDASPVASPAASPIATPEAGASSIVATEVAQVVT
jgi:outer membrane protein assembly factor BamB